MRDALYLGRATWAQPVPGMIAEKLILAPAKRPYASAHLALAEIGFGLGNVHFLWRRLPCLVDSIHSIRKTGAAFEWSLHQNGVACRGHLWPRP